MWCISKNVWRQKRDECRSFVNAFVWSVRRHCLHFWWFSVTCNRSVWYWKIYLHDFIAKIIDGNNIHLHWNADVVVNWADDSDSYDMAPMPRGGGPGGAAGLFLSGQPLDHEPSLGQVPVVPLPPTGSVVGVVGPSVSPSTCNDSSSWHQHQLSQNPQQQPPLHHGAFAAAVAASRLHRYPPVGSQSPGAAAAGVLGAAPVGAGGLGMHALAGFQPPDLVGCGGDGDQPPQPPTALGPYGTPLGLGGGSLLPVQYSAQQPQQQQVPSQNNGRVEVYWGRRNRFLFWPIQRQINLQRQCGGTSLKADATTTDTPVFAKRWQSRGSRGAGRLIDSWRQSGRFHSFAAWTAWAHRCWYLYIQHSVDVDD